MYLPERVRGAGTLFSHFLSDVVDVYVHRGVADVPAMYEFSIQRISALPAVGHSLLQHTV